MRELEAGVASALADWEEGVRRLSEPGPLRDARASVAEAVQLELRRRVGPVFHLADLARVYAGASDWYLEVARRAAPARPEAWDPAVALDGAFGLYGRRAADAPGR